jgi:hypothetical protein
MALCNSPNPESRATVRAFLTGSTFVLIPASEGIQEFLAQRYGAWVERNRALIAREGVHAADVWVDWAAMLRRAVVATGRYTYDADRDAFVPTDRGGR